MTDLDAKVTEACHRIEELYYETEAGDASEVSTEFQINQNRRTADHIRSAE